MCQDFDQNEGQRVWVIQRYVQQFPAVIFPLITTTAAPTGKVGEPFQDRRSILFFHFHPASDILKENSISDQEQ